MSEDNPYLVRVEDGEGTPVTLESLKGEFYPPFGSHRQMTRTDEFEPRPDDVWLCNFPKSGTHWVWEMLNMIIHQSTDFVKDSKDELFFEYCDVDKMQNQPSPRLINTHVKLDCLPPSVIERNKVIYTYRNPKDVAVSHFHHIRGIKVYEYQGSWKGFLPMFVEGKVEYGSWFDHVRQYVRACRDHPLNTLLLAYEDVHLDPATSVQRLAERIGQPVSTELARDVANACCFSRMSAGKKQVEDQTVWREGQGSMYRKGKVGDWRNYFTVAQNAWFDQVFAERAKNLELDLKYTL